MSSHKKRSGKNIAVYPGTFDPITLGHIDLVRRILHLFDEIIIVVAKNSRKKTLFSVTERKAFVEDSFNGNSKIRVMSYEGLTVNLIEKVGASVIVRGLRAVSDFEYEFQMALTNRKLNANIETVFFMPDAKYIYLNSSVVKEIAQFDGQLSRFVTPMVGRALREKLGRRN